MKFDELFEKLEFEAELGVCSCCRIASAELSAYKRDNKLILLCEKCEEFLRELLE